MENEKKKWKRRRGRIDGDDYYCSEGSEEGSAHLICWICLNFFMKMI